MLSHHFHSNGLHNHRRLMNWLVIPALIVLFVAYRLYIYIEKQAALEFARQYVEATYGDDFQIDKGVEHDFSRGTYIISANDIDRNTADAESFVIRFPMNVLPPLAHNK
ncbi:hypothetical protein ABEV00_16450 [Paenibacillus thiaminolyticus]|uniref:hypothetical protein n=1 Tax=Paenibacillus thiaminolyticus TaxID=49283 RepID=UPI003D2654D6